MNSTLECCVVPNAGAGAGARPRGRGGRRRRGFPVRALLALLAAAAVASFAAPADRAMAQTGVNIPDSNLRLFWELWRGKAAGAAITCAEMAVRPTNSERVFPGQHTRPVWTNGLSWNTWNYRADPPNPPTTVIRDLTGMQCATGYTWMTLDFHRITDLTPLARLTDITRLSFSGNQISDLSPLASLTNLRDLNFGSNLISDLSPLARLTGLTDLSIYENQISDLSPLTRLTNLRILNANENQISDISPLAGLTNLRDLSLYENSISDLSPLTRLTNLRDLNIYGNPISDLSPLQGKNLRVLDLSYNEMVTDISVVEGMTNLARLELDGTGVVDLAPLVANTGLGSGDLIYLRDVPNLNADAEGHIATLRGRGVTVWIHSGEGRLRVDTMVRGVQVTPGVESLTITWDPLTAAAGFSPSGYRIHWKGPRDYAFRNARSADVNGLDTTSYTMEGLTPGVPYKVRVRAIRNAANYGTPSRQVSCIPLASASDPIICDPATAGSEELEAGVADGVTVAPGLKSLIVSWNPVDGANGYKVQWKSGEQEYDPETRQAHADGADTTSHTIPGLAPGVEYTVRVITTRTDEPDGDPSEEATGTPVEVVIDDAAATEGDVVEFPVRLTEPSTVSLTLTWNTEDGTAKAGEDYRSVESGRLTFRQGEKEKTLRVQTLEDRRGEASETFLVRLTDASRVDPSAAEDHETGAVTATGTITDDDADMRARAMSMALAGMGHWVAADAVDVIEERFTGSQETEAQVGLAGRTLPLAGVGSQGPAWSGAPGTRFARYGLDPGRLRSPVGANEGQPQTPGDSHPVFSTDSISRSRFNLPLSGQVDGAAPGGTSGWRLWGRGSVGGFDGKPAAGSTIDGKAVAGYLGLDYRPRQDAMVGVALAHSRGDVDYSIDSVTSGEVDLDLTSVLPYAHWSPRAGLGVWGLLGAGWGRAELQDEGGRVETDLRMWMAAAGLRQDVASWHEIDLALKADGFLTELKTGAKPGLPKAKGEARRLRLRLEGSREWEVSPVSRITPKLELGGRWDGGTGEDGLGMEVGGGLAYTHTDLGLDVEARARFLLAHQINGFEEWGGSLTVKVDPGQAGQGPWMTFSPGWGREGSRMAQMWDGRDVFRAHRGADEAPELSPDRLSLEVGWGLPTHGGAGLLTPYAGLSMSGSEMRAYRMGARMRIGSRMSMGLQGRQWKSAQDTQAGYEVLLTAVRNW